MNAQKNANRAAAKFRACRSAVKGYDVLAVGCGGGQRANPRFAARVAREKRFTNRAGRRANKADTAARAAE
jgi:2-polyprenyl-3-methyl-5-hydroxy-6-metoxy-1,4-benzoquinol methylase